MKTLILVILGFTATHACFGQRYEVWLRTSGGMNVSKGNYAFSNDSILATYSNGSLLFRSLEKSYQWDKISELQVRNKTRHMTGQLIGMLGGTLIGTIVAGSMIKSADDKNWGMLIEAPLIFGGITGAGALAGHWITCGKIVIPLNGKNAKEKNQLLKNTMKK